MTRYYATINSRAVGASGLNAEISNIKCPICGQKMDIVRVEDKGKEMDIDRKMDEQSHLWHIQKHIRTFGIKWACMNCTAELSATAREYCETSIDLDKEL